MSERGIWHLTNEGAISWHELAREAAFAAHLDKDQVRLVRVADDTEAVGHEPDQRARPAFEAAG